MKHLSTVAICIALSACGKPQADTETTPAPVAATSPAETAPVDQAMAVPAGFDKTVELQGISFKVEEANGTLTITPSGLETSNEPMTRGIEGQVTGAEAADLDADGSPEVYVFAKGDGDDARGALVGYAANRRKSLSEIYLRPIAEDPQNGKRYRGHDEFAVLENRIGQRFPLVDADGKPTGKTLQLQYKLVPGEAGWQLVVDRVTEI